MSSTSTPPRRAVRLRWALAGALALGALGAAALLWQRAPGADAREAAAPADAATSKPALTVTVATPQPRRWPVTLAANGNIAAWQEAAIGAEVGGYALTEVLVDVGDRVRRGQPLARMSSDTVRAEVAQSRAALAEAQAALAESKANAERARKLRETGAISAQQVAQYLTGEQTAQARVQAARARLDADELKLSKTQVPAPDDGIVSSRTATVGSVVQQGQELFRLIRRGRLEWRAEVPAAELQRIRPGQPAVLTTPGGAQVGGTVRTVGPTVDAQTRNAIVYVDLDSATDAGARPGMFARGEFELGENEALTLPASAVLLRDGFHVVLRLQPDARVAQTKVEIGQRVGEHLEVRGLPADASVVASGAAFLGDGDRVRVVAAPPAPAASGGAAASPADGAGAYLPGAASRPNGPKP